MNYKDMNLEKDICPTISIDQTLKEKNAIIVDVRTPKEYKEAHVKDSINIPLMSDYQRHIIGKTYKEQSKDAAIRKGWDIFEPIVNEFIDRFRDIKEKDIIIYCWRGGMRSRIVVNLLKLFNIEAKQMVGGHKAYMNDKVWKGLEGFEKEYKPKFIVLFGNTGTRKTEILKEIEKKGLPMIDLEGLARHRGSVYGGVALDPRSQKMFSTLLYHKLDELKTERYIFIEGESNKIGNVHLPKFINKKIKNDIKVNVKADIKTRVSGIIKEYSTASESIDDLYKATAKLKKLIGMKDVEMLMQLLDDKEYEKFTEYLLINYYDKRYIHNKADYEYDLEVCSDDMQRAVDDIIEFYGSLIKI